VTDLARRFAQTFVLFCAAQAWVLARTTAGRGWLAYAVFVSACLAGAFDRRFFRAALASTFGAVVLLAAWRFPLTANHLYLQCFVALLLVVTSFDDDSQTTALVSALQKVLIGVFFWSGAQKIVYGAYFDGSFLCWNLVKGTHDAWKWVANVVLPAQELGNVARAHVTNECRFVTPFALVLSNSVYVSELVCAAVLLHPRARARGAIAVAVVLVAIEIVMSEWVFAAFAANLLLLFAAPRWSERARPVFIGWAIMVALLSGRP
jgi:hypothetical protein